MELVTPIPDLSFFAQPDLNAIDKYERIKMGEPVYDDLSKANLVGSLRDDGTHALLLDFDLPTTFVPSSTVGHGHLYVDCHLSFEQLMKVLDVLAEVGIIEKTWAQLTKQRGMAALRTPWTKKTEAERKKGRRHGTNTYIGKVSN